MPTDRPARDRFDALFAGDLANEIREEFEERVAFGLPVPDATAAVVEQFGGLLRDPDDGPVVLLSLAALQLLTRGLQPAVRDAALELLEGGAKLGGPTGDSTRDAERRRLLGELEAELLASRSAEGGRK